MSIDEMFEAFGGALTYAQIVQLKVGRWMTRALAEHPASRERLHRWATAGASLGPFAPNVVSLRGRTLDIARAAIDRMPPPVASHVSAHVLIVGVGPGGFCTDPPRMALEPSAEGLQIVAIREDLPSQDVDSLLKHECAHAWTRYPASAASGERESTAEQRARLEAVVDWPEMANLVATQNSRAEELAHILSAEWGGVGRASDIRRLRRYGAHRYVLEGLRNEVRIEAGTADGAGADVGVGHAHGVSESGGCGARRT